MTDEPSAETSAVPSVVINAMAVIVDLDGTICDCSHRVHHAQNREWDKFHEALGDDPVHEDVSLIIANLDPAIKIIALTGRNEKYRAKTIEWLRENDLETVFEDIIMRPDGDFTQDHILKPKMLFDYFGGEDIAKDVVIAIFDDREKVISAFRDLGLSAFQVRPEKY